MKTVGFSWKIWGVLLLITAVLGAFSGVNSDGISNFGASVRYGFAHRDIPLILAAVLSAVLLLWLLLAILTGELRARQAGQGTQAPRQ